MRVRINEAVKWDQILLWPKFSLVCSPMIQYFEAMSPNLKHLFRPLLHVLRCQHGQSVSDFRLCLEYLLGMILEIGRQPGFDHVFDKIGEVS